MTSRIKIDDFAWHKIFLFLRQQKDIRVGQPQQCRLFLNAVLWITRTGAQWRELPSDFGKWNSIYKRYQRWCQKNIWSRLLEYFSGDPELDNLIPDTTIIRAHPCAAGAKGGNQINHDSRSRGGFSTKIHALVDGLGNPLKIILTAGQKSDIGQAKSLLSGYKLEQVIGDKGYDSDDLVSYTEENGGIAVIPPRSNRLEKRDYDSHVYKERHLVECFFNN